MSNILFIFGTRPEAIKIGPVVAELRELGIEPEIICTGQHTDLLKGSPAETDLAGCENLQIESLFLSAREAGQKFSEYFLRNDRFSLVVVQGDTASAMSGAFAAATAEVPLAHIEAGVRSHSNSPWPEEEIRVEIAQLAKYHYAPTTTAFTNLFAEGVPAEAIKITGNTCVSALERYTKASPTEEPLAQILMTFHRREIQSDDAAEQIANAILSSAKVRPGLKFLWPMHPGFSKRLSGNTLTKLTAQDNIKLLKPMAYTDFADILSYSLGVLTDSGGVVEEAATLGVPCVIARPANDRPEAEAAGAATLLPPTYDGILEGINILACKELERKPLDIYGSPKAAAGIAGHLARILR